MSTHISPRSLCSLLVHTWCLGKFLRPPDSAGNLSWAGAWLEGREEEPTRLAITPFIHTWWGDNVVGVMEEVGDPPGRHPLGWHWYAMWPWQDWTQVCQGLTLQSISVGKTGSNQRWSDGRHCPPSLCPRECSTNALCSPQRPAHQHHSLKLCPSLWPHGHTYRKDQETHFQGSFVFWVAPPCPGVVGTETLDWTSPGSH